MTEVATIAFKEAFRLTINEKFDKKISPSELLKNSEKVGLSGDFREIAKIKSEVSSEEASRAFLPRDGGEWSGEIGDSIWLPNRDEIPKRPPNNEKTWGEILDENGVEGIEFKDGEPDFSKVSEATVEIEEFTGDRNANFTQADEKLADQWTSESKDGRTWTPQDVKEYRKENNLSWHERRDKKTLDLVPQEIHGNIPHSGGISALKNSQNQTA